MRVTLAKFCDYACQVDGGKGTLIGMFDTIGGPQFPLVHPTFFFCVEFEFDPMESGRAAAIKMALIDEDGKELMGLQGQFTIPQAQGGKPPTLFQSFRMDGMNFPKPGHYRMDILNNGDPVGEARLYLVQSAAPPQR